MPLDGNVRQDEGYAAEDDRRQSFDRSPQRYCQNNEQLRQHEGSCRTYTARGQSSYREAQEPGRTITSPVRRVEADSITPSDTELDDDSRSYFKTLPAPKLRPKKGLRSLKDEARTQDSTPFLTPSQLDDSSNQPEHGYFDEKNEASPGRSDRYEARKTREKFTRRRRAELGRRISELVSVVVLCLIVLSNDKSCEYAKVCCKELRTHGLLVLTSCACYPLRTLMGPILRGSSSLGQLKIPAAFDPAPLLYPPTLPILVSLSLPTLPPAALMINIILSLSTLPRQLMPFTKSYDAYYMIHWAFTLIPLMAADQANIFTSSDSSFDARMHAIYLFPLHQALLRALHYLTTTSLLTGELQLLSVTLINLLLQATTPQTSILRALLWIAGLGLFVTCRYAFAEIVALERIPSWRFQKAERVISASQAFSSRLSKSLRQRARPNSLEVGATESSEQERPSSSHRRSRTMLESAPINPVERAPIASQPSDGALGASLYRAHTSPSQALDGNKKAQADEKGPIRTRAAHFSLTPRQISLRKLSLTIYVYVAVVLIVLVPIRLGVAHALFEWEPFGWAMGYLFGDFSNVKHMVEDTSLSSWIPLPPRLSMSISHSAGLVDTVRYALGLANTRLLIFAYWAITLSAGLLTVLLILPYLSDRLGFPIEIDTRRKVFHFTTVALLFPIAFIDPPFVHLTLSLVLAVFLLLDLLRAGQLKPISKPLARFLTPYVDGRDLRGPVIVSHMFLLVGCAIPFWLSLAGYPHTSTYGPSYSASALGEQPTGKGDPWTGWALSPTASHASRDVSMLAGIVCVGMGDAAASLIGRRYGRRKWPWAGGKSLEGSAAFALAVTVGLVVGKFWLRFGGWELKPAAAQAGAPFPWILADDWSLIVGKAALAGCGASFMEAVLTGANDNVVVPVILWLLVRGLDV